MLPTICPKPGCNGTRFTKHEEGWQCLNCFKVIYIQPEISHEIPKDIQPKPHKTITGISISNRYPRGRPTIKITKACLICGHRISRFPSQEEFRPWLYCQSCFRTYVLPIQHSLNWQLRFVSIYLALIKEQINQAIGEQMF